MYASQFLWVIINGSEFSIRQAKKSLTDFPSRNYFMIPNWNPAHVRLSLGILSLA